MIKVEIPQENYTVEIPESIEELTPAQYLELISLVLLEFTPGQRQDRMAFVCLGIDLKSIKKEHFDDLKIMSEIYRVKEYMTFLNEENFELTHTKNLLPFLRIGDKEFQGPADTLDDLEFGEFVHALDAYDEFCTTENQLEKEKHGIRLLSILYRQGKNGDRVPYDQKKAEYNLNWFKRAKLDVIYGVIYWFASCIYTIQNCEEFSVVFEKSKKDEPTNRKCSDSFIEIMFDIAEKRIFGPFNEVTKTNLYLILRLLAKQRREAIELEKKYGNTDS